MEVKRQKVKDDGPGLIDLVTDGIVVLIAVTADVAMRAYDLRVISSPHPHACGRLAKVLGVRTLLRICCAPRTARVAAGRADRSA
ncbi:MAG: hypothetical protein QM679_09520 [Patulibacter sp.]